MKCVPLWVRVFEFFFGRLSWSAPPWLRWCFGRLLAAFQCLRAHPRATLSVLAVLAVTALGGIQWRNWWQSHKARELPLNVVRQVKVLWQQPLQPIAPGAADKDLAPAPLRIRFDGAPVAPLEQVGKEASAAVTLNPVIAGTWKWLDTTTLEFRPESHWVPGQKLEATIHPAALAADIELDVKTLTTSAPPLVAQLRDFSFYNSPQDPSVFQVVGELRVSHPIDLAQLQERLTLTTLGDTPVFTKGSPLFQITADPNSQRRYFIRSRQILVPPHKVRVNLTAPAGLKSVLAGEPLAAAVVAEADVPDKYSGLVIEGAETRIIRTEDGEPQQFLFIRTNLVIDSAEVAQRIGMWWHQHGWFDQQGKLLFDQRVGSATAVKLQLVEGEAPLTKEHAFRFTEPRTHGSLFLRIGEGVKSPGGFETNRLFESTPRVPPFPKETRLLGKGHILALGGERKMIVESRGVDHLRITLSRVPADQFQHLVAMTGYSTFQEPEFNGNFSQNNVVRSWSKVVKVPRSNDWEATQSVVDLAEAPPLKNPDGGEGGRGVFFIEVDPVRPDPKPVVKEDIYSRIDYSEDPYDGGTPYNIWYESYRSEPDDGWQSAQGNASERFVMVTDLGLLVKAGADGSRDVYVMSLSDGKPVADADIQVLARNGTILETVETDRDGHARLKPLDGFRNEQLPVAVMASKRGDVSFLPLNERQLPAMDYSRHDIGGVLASRVKALEAFVFTERGVYRPGDTLHVGFIAKRRDWQPVIEGLPLEVSVTDPRGRKVGSKTLRLPYDGFDACDFPLSEAAALGVYQVEVVVLDERGHYHFRIGRTAVRVEEFQPDRMKVETTIPVLAKSAWLPCKDTDAEVSVRSLFGEAAPDRRVRMKLQLFQARFGFPEWPDFVFYDRNAEQSASRAGTEIDLGELQTREDGKVSFSLPLDKLSDASFRMSVLTEAFERDGGRSVSHLLSCLVSPYESVLGWKADGDLEQITKDGGRELSLLAIGRDLKPVAIDNLRRRVIEIRQVSVLTQLDNGNYAYVSTTKERQLSEEPFSLPAEVMSLSVPTGQAGRFRMEWVDLEGRILCAVPFQVVGKGNQDDGLDRDAELSLQLSKSEVLPGEEIEVFLTAPYAGAGLVTIERETVHVAKWFKSDTKATVVRIKIPKDAEGTYYINGAYVRSTSAAEVFHSPLSYAAAPIRVLAPAKQLDLTLAVPKEVRPGTEARFQVRANQPSRVVVYAVDEGIHQITNYRLPKPVDFFLRKQALEVRTQQWLDLLLPEYRFLKAAPAFGGDGDGEDLLSMHLNPFKRRKEPPVVFWSGVVETGPKGKDVYWQVPDYFNGNLKVMAVACHAGAMGSTQANTLVKAPIILQPNAPLFAAPGDEFEVSLSVFNHLADQSADVIGVKLTASRHLEILGSNPVLLQLPAGRETSVRFRCRANEMLGGAELRFDATGGGEEVSRTIGMSVRPASHHLTNVVTGWFRTKSTEEKVKRSLYPQFRHTEATASVTPLGMARGLEAYVREYPYGCSEQITSRAMVKLVAATDVDFGLSPEEAADAVRVAINGLAGRQRSDGGFGYWYSDRPQSLEFHSLYALHFLTEAKWLGHAVPEHMMNLSIRYAVDSAKAKVNNLGDAQMQAYAIYLLARNGLNPSAQLLMLRDTLSKHYKGQWEGKTMAAWMAATYMLLKQDDEANGLLDAALKLRAGLKGGGDAWSWNYYSTPQIESLAYFYIQCRHFPERSSKFGIEDLEPVMKPLRDQSFNTLACSYMTLALKAYSDLARSTGLEVSIVRIGKDAKTSLLAGPSSGMLRAGFDTDTAALRFERQQKGDGDIGAFYQVVEQGYEAGGESKPERAGLEISRELVPLKKDQPLRPGDPVEVVLRVRNVSGRNLTDLAVVDLMPAGFEVVAGDLKSGAGTVVGARFAELREDRNLFFLGLASDGEWSVKYRMKAVCAGSFVVPAALIEDMYDRGLHGLSQGGRIQIEPAP